jgi:hypothetical protein
VEECEPEYLTQAGVANAHVNLGEVGIHGNEHMMMFEKNDLDIAALISRWIQENVGKGRGIDDERRAAYDAQMQEFPHSRGHS